MKKIILLLFTAVIIGGFDSAVAAHNWFNQTGKWNEPNKWSGDSLPDGNSEILIRYNDSQCILDSNAGNWTSPQRLRVYGDAKFLIADGASLLGVSWMRVGTREGPGKVTQTGGLVRLKGGKDNSKLTIGYENGSQDSQYTIKDGILTYLDSDAYLIVGYRGGKGQLTIEGTKPKIKFKKLYVGGDLVEKAGEGIIEFKIGSDGVSPIQISNNVHIDREGQASTAALIVKPISAPPKNNIVLIENTGSNYVEGKFDIITDCSGAKPAAESSEVILDFGGNQYKYKLSYRYNGGQDGFSNDVALIYEQEIAKN